MYERQDLDLAALDAALVSLGQILTVEEAEAMAATMTPDERLQTIDQAIRVIADLYVHLPMKRPRYAVDPVATLRLLRRESPVLPDDIFQSRLIAILDSLRDVHLAYTPPAPYDALVAFLPFLMERTGRSLDPAARFYVTRLVAEFAHPTFRPGVEIISWDGTPIQRALGQMADVEGGNNHYSRAALALQFMTVRWLGSNRLPDARWVAVGYRGEDGRAYEIRMPWRVLNIDADSGFMFGSQAVWMLEDMAAKAEDAAPVVTRRAPGIRSVSLRSQVETKTRRRLFRTGVTRDTDLIYAEDAPARRENRQKLGRAIAEGTKGADLLAIAPDLTSTLPRHFEAEIIESDDGRSYGYIGIRSFEHQDWLEFAAEFRRLLALMPASGLAIDVRGNPGGVIQCAEGILQFISPRRIQPLKFQCLGTEISRLLADPAGGGVAAPIEEAVTAEDGWVRAVDIAMATGAIYSHSIALSDADHTNVFGQEYYGPCAVVIDATSFSSAEMFAAGFQDHGLGPVIGADPTTGGAGANCWTFDQLTGLGPAADALLGILPLPSGARIRFSARRCVRIGPSDGVPLEELGVSADLIHDPTPRDLLDNNADLKAMICTTLAGLQATSLDVTAQADAQGLHLCISGAPIDRVDVIIDGRILASLDYAAAPLSVTLALPSAPAAGPITLRVEAYRRDHVVANHCALLRRPPASPGESQVFGAQAQNA